MSVPPPDDDRAAELRAVFFESAEELVQRLNEEALRLEQSPGDPEIARGLRRIVHTLKGDAAACNFRELSELAHAIEDVFALDAPEATSQIPEIALQAADCFSALLWAYQRNTVCPDLQTFRNQLASLIGKHSAPLGDHNNRQSVEPAAHWTEYEQLAIARALDDGKSMYHVSVELDPQSAMPIAARQMLLLALNGLGEILALYPPESSAPARITRIEAVVSSVKSPEQIRLKCTIPAISKNTHVTSLQKIDTPAPPLDESASATHEQGPHQAKPASAETYSSHTATPPAPSSPAPENILRVEAERIDSALNLVGELILAKSMLQESLNEFARRFPQDSLRGKFSDLMAFQSRVLNDLQRSVMKIRMVPVEQLFRRFPRVVRDVAHDCGKRVELVYRGGETDLDKGILDALAEPLTHLLRNAVGHGIETGGDRLRAGKPAQGTVRLSAYHQGNQVVIEVSDDGPGIDAEKVRSRAIAQGILKSEEAAQLSEAESLRLILRPGLSTSEEITALSGRGVGLDVVESVLNRLKGTLQIETEPGRGTTFRLRLPLTLAIIRALLFRVAQQLYALPLSTVSEITRITEKEIYAVEHYEAMQLRNQVLPLLRMGPSSATSDSPERRKAFVLVVQHSDRRFGVIVDELAGEEELVIKALDDHSISTDLVSGGAILGDGHVVLILNVSALAERLTRGRVGESPILLSHGDHTSRQQPAQAHGAAGGQP